MEQATKIKVRVSRQVSQYIDVEIEATPGTDWNRGLDRERARIKATDHAKTIPIQEWKSNGDDYEAMLEDEF